MLTRRLLFCAVGLLTLLSSCKDEAALVPKPRMYPRVEFPVREHQKLLIEECPFYFETATYLHYRKDSFQQKGEPVSPCWFDLASDELRLSLHCSYYPLSDAAQLTELIDDSFTITGKHNSKANARRESLIQTEGAGGLLFEVGGPVASPLQFYLTDSTQHFFRASFYFDAKVNPDSTRLVYDFVKEDIFHMIETFTFQ